mgnify:CR=1 FL=1
MFPSKYTLDQLNIGSKGTIVEHLGIEFIEIGENYLRAKMPVDHRTTQPMGLLHGGASVVLIESLGSVGSSLLVDLNVEHPVGLEVNANHVGAARTGYVSARAKIVHAGKRTHVWQVEVETEDTKRLVCTGRLTVMIVKR